ncbi:estradiol 17-beta-dehydrogenase 2 [Drosophila innubila]|uniref:estradiol 17-beta-dehydrogenase 2 n=1 Tax=Drosophila innubila TaxID=198719 RepID=UPI00148D7F5E|nr:estradiol 17-beta-dehydrogenase 2 [Drosophila innubila]
MQVFDNNMRRASRRASLRRGSISALPQKSAEIPWDIFERLSMPFLFCQAAAIVSSHLLHALNISNISTFAVFVWFALSTVGAVLFYHFVKVSAPGKGVLITGCESPLAWYLAKKLDDLGFTVYAGFNTPIDDSDEAKILKEETSGRMKLLHVDVTSETSLLEAARYVSQHLPHGAEGLWALVHCAHWIALGELEWIPFAVLRKSLDLNLLAMTSVEKYSRQAADIQPTLRVLIDAVTRTFPMARYTPVTATEKLQIFLAEHLAPSLYESIYGEQKKFVY